MGGTAAYTHAESTPERATRPAAVSNAKFDASVRAANAVWQAEQVRLWNEAVFTNAVRANEAKAWFEEAARQEAERAEAARAAAAAKSAPKGAPAPKGGSVSGDCFGKTPLSDTLVGNESGGNPNALGPSTSAGRAWGCYQIMAGTWSGHGCAGTWGSASVDEQAACATTIYNKSGRGQWEAKG